MKNAHHLPDKHDWTLRVFAIEHARGILTIPDEIYKTLTDEQKIPFILAGGTPSMSHHRHKGIDTHRETGQLPVLC